MTTPEDARKYLKDALPPGEMSPASLALGKNHAYLQQYIKVGKPRWLSEPVREALVRQYGLDPEKLRPPPARLAPVHRERARGDGAHKGQVNAPRDGKFVDDPRTLQLLDIWIRIRGEDRRDLALRVLTAMADDAEAMVA